MRELPKIDTYRLAASSAWFSNHRNGVIFWMAMGLLSLNVKHTDFVVSIVMAGLVPAIHVFLAALSLRRGCPGQARA
jgi:hypothetical protein